MNSDVVLRNKHRSVLRIWLWRSVHEITDLECCSFPPIWMVERHQFKAQFGGHQMARWAKMCVQPSQLDVSFQIETCTGPPAQTRPRIQAGLSKCILFRPGPGFLKSVRKINLQVYCGTDRISHLQIRWRRKIEKEVFPWESCWNYADSEGFRGWVHTFTTCIKISGQCTLQLCH